MGCSPVLSSDLPSPGHPERILILKPSSLGDVIHAIPVLRMLRRRFPDAWIAWWVDSSLAPLLEGDPDLDEVILFNRRSLKTPGGVWGLARSIRGMRARRFDWVIDLQGLARSALVGWLSNAGMIAGVEDWREGAPALYDLRVPRPSRETHAVDWYVQVIRALGVPTDGVFEWLPERPAVSRQILSRWPAASRRWICLQPGARWWNKRWPVEHFQELVRQLGRLRDDVGFAILGGPSDRAVGSRLASIHPERSLNLAGATTLPEMIEWLRLSELLVTNDTGPMHAAAALGKPVVAVFGPTNPRRTGPYHQEQQVLRAGLPCAPCMKPRCHRPRQMECLTSIEPVRVLGRVLSLLE